MGYNEDKEMSDGCREKTMKKEAKSTHCESCDAPLPKDTARIYCAVCAAEWDAFYQDHLDAIASSDALLSGETKGS